MREEASTCSILEHMGNDAIQKENRHKEAVYANFAYTATDGKIYEVEHYNLVVNLINKNN
ncbi:hypothetical protein Barb4_01507 [Bacteroidales bacterium Barb4]|nr:hypothetical protein Barb4_01507 [Bacteroidales bacterium Barb4]